MSQAAAERDRRAFLLVVPGAEVGSESSQEAEAEAEPGHHAFLLGDPEAGQGPGNSPAEVVVAHHAFRLAGAELASSPEAQEVVRDHLGLDSALPKTEVSIHLPRKIPQ